MHKRYLIMLVVLLLLMGLAALLGACGGEGGDGGSDATEAGDDGGSETTTTLPPSADPIRIVFNAEISGPLVYDTASVRKGVRTALQMLGYRLADWSIEYREMDNKSDPLVAVEQVRELVLTDTDGDRKQDREPVDFICGPVSSSVAAGVTYFLSQRALKIERVPQCSVTPQPSENITTSGGVGFIPDGIYRSYGYYLGKFAAETMHYETANCIHYSDRIAEEIQSGFERGFIAGGGSIAKLVYVPSTTIDFADLFAQMEPADCTMFWVRGNGAIPFVRQYADSDLRGALLAAQSSNYSESQLEYLDALGVGLDMISCDVYAPMLSNAQNRDFIAAFQALYPGEYPTPEAFGGWQAVMLYANAVETLHEQRQAGVTESGAGLVSDSDSLVDPRHAVDVIGTMAKLTMDTPAGPITMSKYGKTYVATRDFHIFRSRDVGSGRIAWSPLYTYSQVLMGQ